MKSYQIVNDLVICFMYYLLTCPKLISQNVFQIAYCQLSVKATANILSKSLNYTHKTIISFLQIFREV